MHDVAFVEVVKSFQDLHDIASHETFVELAERFQSLA